MPKPLDLTKLSDHDFNLHYHAAISVQPSRRTKDEEQTVRRAIIERDRRKAAANRRQAMARVASKVKPVEPRPVTEVHTEAELKAVKKAPLPPRAPKPPVPPVPRLDWDA